MLWIAAKRLVIIALTGLLLGACQQASVRKDADPPAELSLERARALVAEFETSRHTPPPRSIADVRRLLGTGREIPSNCPQQRIDRQQRAKEARAGLSKVHEGYQPSYRASSFASFAVLGLAERAFDIGDYRSAIEYTEQGMALSRSIPTSRWLMVENRNVDSSALFRLLMNVSLARIYATMGDVAGTAEASAQVESLYSAAREGYSYGHFAIASRLLARAQLQHLKGELTQAEYAYRKILATTHWSSNAFGELDLAWVGAQLASLLRQQNRLLDAELVARSTVQKAWHTYRYSELQVRVGHPTRELAAVLLEQGRLDEALYVGQMAVNFYEAHCSDSGALPFVLARRTLIRILAAREDWQAVNTLLSTVRTELSSQPDAVERLYGLDPEPGLALVASGRRDEGFAWLRATLARAEAAHGSDSLEAAEARGYLAMGLHRSGDSGSALAGFTGSVPLLLQARTRASAAGAIGTRARAHAVMTGYSVLLHELAAGDRVSASGLDAVNELFKLSQSISLGRVQAAFGAAAARAAARDPALVELVREEQDTNQQLAVLLDVLNGIAMAPPTQVNPAIVASLQAQLRQLRSARDVLSAEVDRRFPDYRELMRPKALSIAAAQRALAADEALVVFQVSDAKTLVWAIPSRGPASFATVKIERDALARKVRHLRTALDPGAISTLGEIPDFDVAAAAELYQSLLQPVASAWKSKSRLFVVADGPLGQLPLSLLVTEPQTIKSKANLLFARYRSVPWLAREHAVTVLPAVASLSTFDQAGQARASRAFVGFGDPVFGQSTAIAKSQSRGVGTNMRVALRSAPKTRSMDSAALSTLPSLPETADELRSVAAALGASPDKDVFLGAKATEERVKSMNLKNVKVLAFATHGLLPGDIDGLDQPGLALSSPAVTAGKGDGLLTVDEILALRLTADWAVLSACNTGAADGRGAEAISGLGRAFFYAGAQALLVSNWPVHSEATRELVSELFSIQGRRPQLARTEALRQASLAMAEKGVFADSDGKALFSYAHPIFWAPFSVVGNGR
jgi:CHAT domain-containing protein